MPKYVRLNSVTAISQSSSKNRRRPPPSADGPRTGAQLERFRRRAHGLDLRALGVTLAGLGVDLDLVDDRDQADGRIGAEDDEVEDARQRDQRLGERVVAKRPGLHRVTAGGEAVRRAWP